MPASICPVAILLAISTVLSSEVPQARAVVIAGVVGASPEDRTASRARFQSAASLITAPNATSPSSTPCRSNFSTSAPSVFTAMPKLPTSAYAVLLRQNGMRTPPRMAARLVMWISRSESVGWYYAPTPTYRPTVGTSKNLLRSTICAPAVLGLRRQEAEANSKAGPQGMPQERHVILIYDQ